MLTPERLREVLNYDPAIGISTWRVKTAHCVKIGARAGWIDGAYRRIEIDGVIYKEHRLAWLYMTGRWPEPECDHRDLDGLNNKWDNLREATTAQNCYNRGIRCDNSSGIKGVHWREDKKKWHARIGVSGKRLHLGYFETKEQAADAYMRAAHEYFGEFARSG